MSPLRTLRRASLLAIALAATCAFAQNPPPNTTFVGGQAMASAFGRWSAPGSAQGSAGGTGTVQMGVSYVTAVGGQAIEPFFAGVPLTISDGANTETVTVISSNCQINSQSSCNWSAHFANSHNGGVLITSGTKGLQEAVNTLLIQGGTVVTTPDWNGTTAQIEAAVGNTKVEIIDERTGAWSWYGWNGSAYTQVLCVNNPPPGVACITFASGAVLNAPTINGGTLNATGGSLSNPTISSPAITGGTLSSPGIANPTITGGAAGQPGHGLTGLITTDPWLDVRAFGASGSTQTTTFTSTASNPAITLASAIDLANGEGVNLAGAGVSQTFPTAPTPTVAAKGTTGSTHYCYAIIEYDAGEGTSAPGSGGCITNGNATLANAQTYNQVQWYPPTGSHPLVEGYAVYAQYGGSTADWVLAAYTDLPGYAQPWTCNTQYFPNQYAVPTNFQTSSPANQTGHFYMVTTPGTSAACHSAPHQNDGQPSWPTTNGGTVTDGSVVWTEQPLVWDDTQAVALFGPYLPGQSSGWTWMTPSYHNASPPAAQPDALITSVLSGAGTTSIVLNNAPSQSIGSGQACSLTAVSTGCLSHDDTAAIQAALAAQAASCNSITGLDANATCKRVWFPNGIYADSSPLTFSSYLYIGGESNASVASSNPAQDIFYSTGAYNVTVRDLRTLGGRIPYDIGNPDINNSTYHFENINVQNAADYAFALNDQSGTNTLQCLCLGNRRTLFNNGYTNVLPGTWMEGSVYNWFPAEADFNNYVTGYMAWDDVLTVPGATIPFRRMIDNWTSLDIDKSRFGGEGPNACIYNFGGYLGPGAPGNPYWYGGSISIKNSALACIGFNTVGHPDYGVIVLMNQDFPSTIDIENVNNATQTQLFNYSFTDQFGVAQGTNLDTVFNSYFASASTGPDGLFNITCNSGQNAPPLCLGGNPSGVPAQLVSLFHPSEARQWYGSTAAAPPNGGLWSGASSNNSRSIVWNQRTGNGGPMGWIAAATGRAAPAWQASTTYTLASIPAGTGNDYVTASPDDGHVFYINSVSSGSTCTSGGSQPSWNTSSGALTADGTCGWKEGGSSIAFLPFGQPTCSGVSAAMTAGTVTVSASCITGSNPISLTVAAKGGTQGILSYTQSAGSLVITSTSNTDTSTVSWVQN